MNTNTVKLVGSFNAARLAIKRLVSLTAEVSALGGLSKLGGSKVVKLTTEVGDLRAVALSLLTKRGANVDDDSVASTEAQLKAGIACQRALDVMAKSLGLTAADITGAADVFEALSREGGPKTDKAAPVPAKAEKAKVAA